MSSNTLAHSVGWRSRNVLQVAIERRAGHRDGVQARGLSEVVVDERKESGAAVELEFALDEIGATVAVGGVVGHADDGVPRTLTEDRCRRRFRRMRSCMRDEGARPLVWWPFAVALQGEAANHREVRRSRAGVLSVAEKARCQRVRCGSRRRARANHR